MNSNPSLHRRHLLAGSASALAAVGLGTWSTQAAAQAKPLPPYATWKDAGSVIVHSTNTIETRRSAFGTSVITPVEQLYVRNNLPSPPASILDDRDAWTVSIEGVRNPRTLTLGELKTMGLETVTAVLQCSGNGRGFFPHKPSGTPWTVGAAGCVIWSGVPVRAVVEALGGVAGDTLVYLTGTGGEVLPEGVPAASVQVERSMPIKAMGEALLAWEMNGAPLTLAHGGPVRLVVPGYNGVNNIKYVKRVALTATESTAKIMQHGYRMAPVGGKADPSQDSVLEMNVKSWINSPHPESGTLKAGQMQIHGVAFSGGQPVTKVEVSVDGGKTWHLASFVGPDMGRFAWRQFALHVKIPAGKYVMVSRATDAAGNVQPEQRLENQSGYSNNSWADHGVKVTVA